MDQQQSEAIREFCGVTGATPEQAAFFLESSAWDLDGAMSAYYDSGGADSVPGPGNPRPEATAQGVVHGSEDDDDDYLPDDSEDVYPPQPAVGGAGAPPGRGSSAGPSSGGGGRGQPRGNPNSKIRSLRDLSQDDEEDDGEDGPNEYYTGGEKSGMMVQDPNRPGRKPSADAIFDRARQLGAREGTAEDLGPPAGASGGGAFAGVGRTLGAVGGPAATPPPPAASGPAGGGDGAARPGRQTITFWRNGFTIGDGPLRGFNDPANMPFLQSIMRQEMPRELAGADGEVNLVKRDADYEAPPEPRYRAFTGQGRTLGSSDPVVQPPPASPSLAPEPSAAPAPAPPAGFAVDDSQPFTSVQIKLADGTRMVARFNHTHTIADVRRFIEASRPGLAGRPFTLQTVGFPPKQLSDAGETVEQAGLLNAVIIQR